jgi:hypothetical protein
LSALFFEERRTTGDTRSRANQRFMVLRCGGLPGHSISAPASHETSSTGLFIGDPTLYCSRRDAIENELINLALNPTDHAAANPHALGKLSPLHAEID